MTKQAFDKIAEGLKEAIAVAKREKAPAKFFNPKCPFGKDFICVQGYRYKQVSTEEIVDIIKKDLPPGLLYVGKCDCCSKATGGVK